MDHMGRHDRHEDPDLPSSTRATWNDGIVLVCSECDGAKGLDAKQTRQVVKHEAKRVLGRRAVIVVETGCLDICPKKAVAVAAMGADGRWDRAVTVRSQKACHRFVADLAADRPGERRQACAAEGIEQRLAALFEARRP
jgi:hypothetical protein